MTSVHTPLWNLFHTLWTKAVNTPGYDKHQWLEMEKEIFAAEKQTDVSPPEPNRRLETFAVLAGGFYIGSRFTREDAEKWAKELFEERPSWPPEIQRMVEIGDDEQIVDHAQTAFDDALWKVLTEAQWEIAKLRARESRSHWIEAVVKRDDYGAYCIPLPSGIFDGKVPYQWQAGQTVLIQRKDP